MGRNLEGRTGFRRITGSLLALACASGCSSVELSSINLEELHAPNGRHKSAARVISKMGYVFRQFLPNLGREGAFKDSEPKPVLDPASDCLGYLNDLASTSSDHPATQATQVRHFAWLATVDPWSLSRERAVFELGKAAARLEMRAPVPPPEVEANEAELSEALAGLVEVLRPIFSRGGSVDATGTADLQAACDLLGSMDLGLQGGRRVLKAFEALMAGARGRWETLAPLRDLNEDIQRRVTGMALGMALNDNHPAVRTSPRVRSAAIFANWYAFGSPFLGDELLYVRAAIDQGPPLPYDDLELIRLCEIIEAEGLPMHPEMEPAQQEERRNLYLQVLTILGTDFTLFEDRVRTSGMKALGAVSGAGFTSLREEEWTDWWDEQLARIRAADEKSVPTAP